MIVSGQTIGTVALKIERQGDGVAASPLWSHEFGPRFTTPVLKAGLLYGYDGHFYCVDA